MTGAMAVANPPRTTDSDFERVSPPGWLGSQLIAVDVSHETLKAEIARFERLTTPASREEIAVKLEDTLALFETPANWDRVARFYFEALEDVPSDLVDAALKHVRMTRYSFPKPVDLRAPVVDELDRRKVILARLRSCQRIGLYRRTA